MQSFLEELGIFILNIFRLHHLVFTILVSVLQNLFITDRHRDTDKKGKFTPGEGREFRLVNYSPQPVRLKVFTLRFEIHNLTGNGIF